MLTESQLAVSGHSPEKSFRFPRVKNERHRYAKRQPQVRLPAAHGPGDARDYQSIPRIIIMKCILPILSPLFLRYFSSSPLPLSALNPPLLVPTKLTPSREVRSSSSSLFFVPLQPLARDPWNPVELIVDRAVATYAGT